LGECPKNEKKEAHISDEFKNLSSMTASIGMERGAVLGQYSRELALEGEIWHFNSLIENSRSGTSIRIGKQRSTSSLCLPSAYSTTRKW